MEGEREGRRGREGEKERGREGEKEREGGGERGRERKRKMAESMSGIFLIAISPSLTRTNESITIRASSIVTAAL